MTVSKFVVISPHPQGSYLWALDQLDGGNKMRRPQWPIEFEDDGTPNPLFIFKSYAGYGPILGFSTGVIGADWSFTYEGLGTPSNGYSPSYADRSATDWHDADHMLPGEFARARDAQWSRRKKPRVYFDNAPRGIPREEDAFAFKPFGGSRERLAVPAPVLARVALFVGLAAYFVYILARVWGAL